MLSILYQDDHLVAIDKPAGLLVHRSGLDAGETRFAVQQLREQIGRPVWPVHRLDKPTSGALLFALDAASARALASVFQENTVRRSYVAMVRGWPADEGLIDHALRRMADDVRSTRGLDVQPARTRFRTLQRLALPLPDREFADTRCARVELMPESGRRHQLRRHCKHMSHPIIGDTTHGQGQLNRAVASLLGAQRLWLHALRLELTQPVSGAPLVIEAPTGNTWQAWERAQTRPIKA